MSTVAAPDRVTPRSVYLDAVCLITVVVGLVAAVQLARGTVAILSPEPDVSYVAWTPTDGPVTGTADGRFLSPEQRAELRRPEDVRGLLTAGTTLLLVGGLYAVHRRLARSERSARGAAARPPAS